MQQTNFLLAPRSKIDYNVGKKILPTGGRIMSQYLSDITALSSKGQVVLPKAIRESMGIDVGAKLMVISDGNSILLKPIVLPDIEDFRKMMDSASKWAEEVGLTEEDIDDAIKDLNVEPS